MEIALRGIGVSPGIAIGPAVTFGLRSIEVPRYRIDNIDAEKARFEEAIASTRVDIQKLYEYTAETLGSKHADIFLAHLMILEDVALRDEVERRLESESVNVEFIIDDTYQKYVAAMEKMDDVRLRERARDFTDVSGRLLRKLLSASVESLERLEHPSVIISHDLAPSDTAKMDRMNTLGMASDMGGPTSHTAILARAFEIPAVVGLKYVSTHTVAGDTVILDGDRGTLILRPTEATIHKYKAEKRRRDKGRKALLEADDKPSITLDGHDMPVMANIELPVELAQSIKVKAKGIGLYRTEYLFLNRSSLPSEAEQVEAYRDAAEAMKPEPVVLRTLDIGGDKFADHLHSGDESNPQLGWRSIRFCLERPDLFHTQLRAMFRASVHGNVQIMFPLISGVDEWRRVKETVREVCAQLENEGVPFDKDTPIGTMIEVPSAVEIADMLAKECDFFSIGTNDLIQYSLAVDRANELIAHMYEPAHPAVLRMIRRTVKAAHSNKIPCSVCGEMAGDPLFTEVLLGLGVTALSMSSVSVPMVRAEINSIHFSQARRLARRVIGMASSEDIKKLMQRRYARRRKNDVTLRDLKIDDPIGDVNGTH
ncbi:MAG: phosphoenolpyruvate-protein phosphotransferase [Candidatus Hydrogenedentota bacterium]